MTGHYFGSLMGAMTPGPTDLGARLPVGEVG